MPDEANSAGDQQNDQQGEGKPLPTTVEGWQKYTEALQKRLKERDDKIDLLSGSNSSLADRIKAIEKAQSDKLEKDGDYKSLAEKHAADVEKYKPLAERASALEAIIRESNEARIKAVPDQFKNMIPSDYPPEKLQTWLNANEALLVKQPAPNYDAGAGGNGGSGNGAPKLTLEEQDAAKKMGITAEEYAKAKAKLSKSN